MWQNLNILPRPKCGNFRKVSWNRPFILKNQVLWNQIKNINDSNISSEYFLESSIKYVSNFLTIFDSTPPPCEQLTALWPTYPQKSTSALQSYLTIRRQFVWLFFFWIKYHQSVTSCFTSCIDIFLIFKSIFSIYTHSKSWFYAKWRKNTDAALGWVPDWYEVRLY